MKSSMNAMGACFPIDVPLPSETKNKGELGVGKDCCLKPNHPYDVKDSREMKRQKLI